ncbi:tRNA1(Val) (adenine(37)-N6)-methyltransferase [Flaviaesturariibacter amylovorans]
MAQPFFRFKQFTIRHDRCAMKVTTDACLFGAWCAEALRSGPPVELLDIGTGTGLLSLLIAQQCDVRIDAVEIDPEAEAQAAENIAAAPFGAIRIIGGDILATPLPQYGAIVSNPPFYESEIEPEGGARSIAHHSGGLRWAPLFAFLKAHLKESGTAFLLLPYKRRGDLARLLQEQDLSVQAVATVHPTPGHEAARLMVRLGHESATVQEEVIYIKEGDGYSPRFVDLLRPYYLYL